MVYTLVNYTEPSGVTHPDHRSEKNSLTQGPCDLRDKQLQEPLRVLISLFLIPKDNVPREPVRRQWIIIWHLFGAHSKGAVEKS